MTIKDDPTARIKAAIAKRFMGLTDEQAKAQARIVLESYELQAILTLRFNGRGSPQLLCDSLDERGCEILGEWGEHFARIVPESLHRLEGAYVLAIHQDGIIDTATWGSKQPLETSHNAN